jgi:uncharacterized protein (TIGR03067 family)
MVRDLDRLQGTWHVTSIEADGQTLAAAAFDGATIVIKGSLFISLSMGATYEGTVDIHQTRKPKSLDLVFTAGPEKGNRNLGIYRLDGDRWTICLATRGNTRPKTFATKPGTGIALNTSTSPHAIEYESLEGASKGKRQSGIFKLTGETLKMCVSAPGKPRPADFSSKAGDGRSYTTWRRGRSRRRVH